MEQRRWRVGVKTVANAAARLTSLFWKREYQMYMLVSGSLLDYLPAF